MTGNEILTLSLSLLGEGATQASDYESYSLSALNIIIAECLDVQNMLNRSKGKEPLTKIPVLSSLDDVLCYDEELIYQALCYGLAAKLILEDSETAKFNYFQSSYNLGLESLKKGEAEKINDVYGSVI